MCIRDSFVERSRAQSEIDEPLGQHAFGGPVVVVELAAGLDPVSYTHLRAHETVLDLVCRLLLEKKQHLLQLTYYASTSHSDS